MPGLNPSNDPANDNFLSKIVESSNRNGMNHSLFGPITFNKSAKKCQIENKKLSYEVFNKITKDAVFKLGLNPDDFGTHSARSGGATCLAPHISEFNLMLNGRWSDSRSIGSYVETSGSERFEINKILDINL